MTGCWVSRKCLFACLPVEESQQPTWPHDRHSRRATQKVPSVRHSSQASGVFCGGKLSGVSPAKCSHELAIISSDLKCQQAVEKPHLLCCARSPRFNVSENTPPLVDFSRASHLRPFEQPESEFSTLCQFLHLGSSPSLAYCESQRCRGCEPFLIPAGPRSTSVTA